MPVGPVDDKGTALYYEDSGVPGASTTYATIFLVHGTMFHSGIFRPMVPYAAVHNLRLVLVNLRDYPGSSPYSPTERELLAGPGREAQAAAIQNRGLELAAFITWFIEQEQIPPTSRSAAEAADTTGGFALLGWSSANCQTIPVIAHADKMPEKTRKLFNAYFRAYFFHDSSLTGIGEAAPQDMYGIFRDARLTYEEKVAGFPAWVSSYFTRVDLEPETPAFLSTLTSRKAVHEDTDDARWTPSVLRMSDDVFAAVADPSVMLRSQVLIQNVDVTVYGENLRRALSRCYIDGDNGREEIWPSLKLRALWCDMSVGEELLAASKIMGILDGISPAGRNLEFVRVENANHFVHWDQPETFVRLLANEI
ncbi:alpha/beta-hydrolase [Sparassis latifolia]|uniref:Uncharacterized protein n=1 Tax=Sparassis crispa TaxID=139825 RepID=A0A401GLJ1_9APHY|nr:hypothetical protein SCP_0500320 [Sparassis crispa]GBE82989.1 hypothetical protein SCP_0500320 [Sparassis crispa]